MTDVHASYVDSAKHWFGRAFSDLDGSTRRALTHASDRRVIATAPSGVTGVPAGFGERTADAVARFGGSWAFIGLFAAFLAAWTLINVYLPRAAAPDPYPFIFLNLLLSMLAAVQAPFIMMSQNRQASKDRQMAIYDYEVNVKAEIEIMALHDKLDALRRDQIITLETLSARIEQLAAVMAAPADAQPAERT